MKGGGGVVGILLQQPITLHICKHSRIRIRATDVKYDDGNSNDGNVVGP